MIDFRIRDNLYPLAIWKLRRLFEQSQWWSASELVAYQERRLRAIVEHAYRHVPYYEHVFDSLKLKPADIRTVEDLAKLPTLSKATVRKEFERLQADNRQRFHPRLTLTSGSSGDPLGVLLDKPARVLEFVYYWRHWSWAGYRLGMPFAHLSSQKFLDSEESAGQASRAERVTGRLLLNTLWLGRDRVPAYVEAIRRHRPRFLKGVASALYYFAHFFRETGVDDVRFDGVFSTGEVLPPGQRAVIEEVFRSRVYDSYGHTERTVAASECPAGGRHVNPEYGIFELVDRRSEADDGPGHRIVTGHVVGTALHNFSMPLLRYEVGDVAEIEEPLPRCPCGRAMPLLRRINGRQGDVVVTPGGRVSATLFVVFEGVPGIEQGQVIQETVDHLRLRIVRSPAYTDESERHLKRSMRRFVGPEMAIDLEYLTHEEMHASMDGKFRAIVSRIR